jgi:hypothetical protein
MEQHELKLMVAHAGKTLAGHVERPDLFQPQECRNYFNAAGYDPT